ncbi:MAG: hypothetical protein OdinLCB4_005305 [Candidatus Odinarchaeum yellowstonii]|uniref:Uncharacterized protein n=1 Tax=Odinarchaeota yellowstonii (strain LCB_4) TaxID=1841599 RepID=A0AAF0D1F2_ODILC|nr:MAG: hypothetical protein OdinLCB4_005305 [Candidatus Odinarchaeum yellowstonii]
MTGKTWRNVYFQIFHEDESKPFCVCRADSLRIDEVRKENIIGSIEGFFTLMGTIIEFLSDPGFSGSTKKYVICWADETIADEDKKWLKLTGVRLLESADSLGGCEKQRYRCRFTAEKFLGGIS